MRNILGKMWPYILATVVSILNLVITGRGWSQTASLVLAIALLINAERANLTIILAWGLVSLWSNNGVIWITAIIATIAMCLVSRNNGVVPAPTAGSVDSGEQHPGTIRANHYIGKYSDRYDAVIDYRAHARVPLLRIPIPWITFVMTDENVIIRDAFLVNSDPEKLSLIQNQNHTDTFTMNVLGCGTYRFQTKKLGELEYKEWHFMPSWLITKVSGRWEKK